MLESTRARDFQDTRTVGQQVEMLLTLADQHKPGGRLQSAYLATAEWLIDNYTLDTPMADTEQER